MYPIKKLIFILLMAVLAAILPAAAQDKAPEKTAVAVLQFEPRNISQAEAVILSDRLRAELVATNHFNVLEREQMDKILREQKLQLTGACSDASCLVKVGQLMAVTKMMGGTISKIGNTYTVQARVIDVEKGVIETEVSQDFTGTIEDVQQWGMKKVVWKLVPSASLFVSSIPADADVYWDARKVGKTDLKIENEGLGTHKLVLKKPGYQDYEGLVSLKEVKDYDMKVRLSVQEYQVALEGNPPGAEVWLGDTVNVGKLPCSVKLPFGTYNFKFKAKGYHPVSGLVAIDRDQGYTLKLDLKRKSRVKAGFTSLFFPGMGQWHSDRKTIGALYLVAWMGGVGWTGASIGAREDARKNADDAENNYLQATNAVAASSTYDEWQSKYSVYIDRDKQMKTAIYATAGLWAFQFIDAIAFFPGKPKFKVAPVPDKTGGLKTSLLLTYSW
ncbi:PEGA domain-containing protein [candidate division TA06 bacterium]|nr:PEGA domain-containing protein [candidate division TA06 bacterium]